MRTETIFGIVVVALLVVGALVLYPSPQTSTSTSALGATLFTSGISPQGLELEVSLNSTKIPAHSSIAAYVEVQNTLKQNASFAWVTNPNMSAWGGYDFVCGGNDLLLGFAVFEGTYSAKNFSMAETELQLAPPFYPPCMAVLLPAEVTFLPGGDRTIATYNASMGQQPSSLVAAENATTGSCSGSGLSGHGGSIGCSATNNGLLGYWNDSVASGGDLNFTSRAFMYFPPGRYTIVAADDWNQYVYATFVVD
jgi:hypothetical protein